MVDEEKPGMGWGQSLTVLQAIVGTQVTAFFLGLSMEKISMSGGDLVLYGWQIALVVSLLIAILILCTSDAAQQVWPRM